MVSKILLVTAILAIGFAASEKPTIRFPAGAIAKIGEALSNCLSNTAYKKEEVLGSLNGGAINEDRAYQEAIHCVYVKSGLVEGDRVDEEKILALYPADANMKTVINDCGKETGKDKVETVYKFYKCTSLNSLVLYDFS